MLRGDLEKSESLAISAPNAVVISFAPGYNRQYSTCVEPTRLARIQDALSKITGEACQVRVEMRPGEAPTAKEAATEGPAVHEAVAAPMVDDPLFRGLREFLDARELRVDLGFGRAVTTVDTDDEPAEWTETEED